MPILITGARGFVGQHLTEHFSQKKCGWTGLIRKKKPSDRPDFKSQGNWIQCDLIEPVSHLLNYLKKIKPDTIYHLAAQASVASAWKNPEETFQVNVIGTLHLLEALKQLNTPCKLLVVESGEVYGRGEKCKGKLTEESPLAPENPYAASKAAVDMLLRPYLNNSSLKIFRARPFNHIGPGQSTRFVVSHFASQIAAAEAGKTRPELKVGNLKAKRDFTDVRDVVRAYEMIVEKGKEGEAYNIGSGNVVAVDEILKKLLSLSSAEIEVKEDPGLFRPNDIPMIGSFSDKLYNDTGWKPGISLDQSLKETLDYWRKEYQHL